MRLALTLYRRLNSWRVALRAEIARPMGIVGSVRPELRLTRGIDGVYDFEVDGTGHFARLGRSYNLERSQQRGRREAE